DFITLLFAFFVVMYSISSVNEGKYKVLSESLEGVFNAPAKTIKPIQVGDISPRSTSPDSREIFIQPMIGESSPPPDQRKKKKEPSKEDLQLEMIAGEFEDNFEDLIFEEKVSVQKKDDWIEISLDDTVVFQSGGVEPVDDALPIIEKIAGIMNQHDNAMLVEGHTDNVPIRSPVFPSNWELSAARAATVVRYLALEGVSPSRMGAMGYGEFQPAARNDTAAGKSKNRRVVLLISKSQDIRQGLMK
ncbi:flagellar motor protein MotD, partial [Oleiphilus sp. HI0072]